MCEFDLRRWCASVQQGQGEIEGVISQALGRVRILEQSVAANSRIAQTFMTMMHERLEAMNGVLTGCQKCIDGKGNMATTASGRSAYELLQPLISHLEQQASALTASVQEVLDMAKVVEHRHHALTRTYLLQKKFDRERIQKAESRLKGKLLDIRKAKIAMAYNRLDAVETKLNAFESEWKLRQDQFDEFKRLVERVQECSRKLLAPIETTDSKDSE
ncbi:hypothetical protein GYMLUDRAFT_68155 [Collybiopsis luxurians FD-317 M1]|nr:hypothetical protein GYMLUDRAFT_68155 [Collybiopsis luxurians FD-317 M1]